MSFRFHVGRESRRGGAALALILAAGSPLPVGAADSDATTLHEQLEATQREAERTRDEVAELKRHVADLEAAARSADATPTTTARIAPVNADNPAVSFVVDTALDVSTQSSWQSIGYPDGWNFTLKNGELFISAPIDPFLRGYTSINGTSDEGFDVEEAAIITTSLPWGLTLKGGRFFADVGRLPHWHDEALPFVDRPPSIDRMIGGESGSEGLEASWLMPIDLFIEVTGGLYDAVGSENLETLNDDGFFGRRSFQELNFLGRIHGYVDLSDTFNAELGGSWTGIPRDEERSLWALDVTLRHQPGTQSSYQGLDLGAEWMWNSQRFTERDDGGAIMSRIRRRRQGGYAYVEAFFARRFSVGARFDYSESPEGAADRARTASAFVTWKPSEFQRVRFQFDNSWGDQQTNQRFTIQWTAFIGSHSHGFAQR